MFGKLRTLGAGAVDVAQLARFVLGGVAGATANLTGAYVARGFTEYRAALLIGLAIGFAVSFVASKFAFRSRSLARTSGELARFVAVYAVGTGCALATSMLIARGLMLSVPLRAAEMGGAFCGSATMAVTSYLGHRFFTYRHLRNGHRRSRPPVRRSGRPPPAVTVGRGRRGGRAGAGGARSA